MSTVLWGKLIDAIPPVAWVVFALIVFLTLRKPIVKLVLPRLDSIKLPGVELKLVSKVLEDSEGTGGEPRQALTANEREGLLRRINHALDCMKAGRILWIDYSPETSRFMINVLAASGMSVEVLPDTERAFRSLDRNSYDLIVVNSPYREIEQTVGPLLNWLREASVRLPIIVMTRRLDYSFGESHLVFAHASRTSDAIHYVIDIMERIRLAGFVA